MLRMLWIVAVVVTMLVSGCGSPEQPPVKPPTPVAAAPATPAVPPPAVIPQAAPKPAAPAVTAAVKPEPAPVAAKPAAAAKPPAVADILVLPASQGKVTLPHLAHAKLFPCATCHGEAAPGKIGLTKETAHALCRDCHKAKGAGPTACGECHKK